ncbi:sodium-dependent glucose transporter 1C-like isoform X2 [Brevipalpus obovatus]
MISGIFFTLAPWTKSLVWLEVLVFIGGIGQGILDLYCNLSMLHIWGKKSSNFMQALSMCFGIGSLITPMIASPFFLPLVNENVSNSTIGTSSRSSFKPEDVKVQFAFMIIGGYVTIIGLLFSYYCVLDLRSGFTRSTRTRRESSSKMSESIPVWKQYSAVSMVALMAHLMFGMEGIIGNLAPAFGVKSDLKMNKKSAALLVTAFWTCFSFFKIAFVPLTLFFGEKVMTYTSLLIMLSGVILMVPHASYNQLCTWISFILLGIGDSPLFAIAYATLERFFPVNTRQTAIIFVGGVIGDSIHPRIIGSFMENSPNIFVYYLGSFAFFSIIIMFMFPFVCNWLFKKQPKKMTPEKNAFMASKDFKYGDDCYL